MRKLQAVQNAREIMKEGTEWGVWKWLLEKKRVRGIADEARAALDEFEMKVKATWSDDLKSAYNHLVGDDGDAKRARKNKERDKGFPAKGRFSANESSPAGERSG
jgi:hypothetical protein